MRKDISKILVTTPRSGSSWKNFQVKKERRRFRDGDYDLPIYSSMRPKDIRGSHYRKSLSEYLNPLVRFLQKNTGKSWDCIYSEICNMMDKRNQVQNHIFSHLFDYVELNPHFIDEYPHYPQAGRYFNFDGNKYVKMNKNGWTFYVDKDGILREPAETAKHSFQKKSNPNTIFTKSLKVFYVKRAYDGTWFKASIVKCEDPSESGIPDWIRKEICSSNIWNKISANSKLNLKTLSKKEKRKLNIK